MAQTFCPNCGNPMNENERFCSNCGYSETMVVKGANTPNVSNAPNPNIPNAAGAPVPPQTDKNPQNLLMIIIILLVLLLMVAVGFAVYFGLRGGGNEPAVAVPDTVVQTDTVIAVQTPPAQEAQPKQQTPSLSKTFYGRIGGDEGCILFINGTHGYYTFLNYSRNVKLKSYDPSSGRMVVNGYEEGSGKYIGKFVGTYNGSRYSGTFTNYKGISISFDLR